MVAAKSSRVNRQYKTKYRIRNWREYERGLRSRGDQLAIVFCNVVREAVIQALRREGTPHHHNPAPDGKHN